MSIQLKSAYDIELNINYNKGNYNYIIVLCT